jgi:hypothetical protein
MPLFDYVAKKLRAEGAEVFSPAEHLRDMYGDLETLLGLDKESRKWARREALKDEILWIIDNAQIVLLLPGWERSPGATAERAVAMACDIEVRESGNIILPSDSKPLDPVAAQV